MAIDIPEAHLSTMKEDFQEGIEEFISQGHISDVEISRFISFAMDKIVDDVKNRLGNNLIHAWEEFDYGKILDEEWRKENGHV